LIDDGFSADRRETEIVVGFGEGRTVNVDLGQPIDHLRQLDLIRYHQHDEMRGFSIINPDQLPRSTFNTIREMRDQLGIK
jgi:hypothetical protein